MSKIKTKEVIKGTIKNLDKGAIVAERTKDNLVNIKEKVNNITNTNYKNKKHSFIIITATVQFPRD